MNDVKDEMKAFKLAYAELMSMSKNGESRLDKAIKSALKAKQKDNKSAVASKSLAAQSLPLFEFASEMCSPALRNDAMSGTVPYDKWSEPTLLTNLDKACPDFFVKTGDMIKQEVDTFVKKFEASDVRESKGPSAVILWRLLICETTSLSFETSCSGLPPLFSDTLYRVYWI